jgi:hypothetical protein
MGIKSEWYWLEQIYLKLAGTLTTVVSSITGTVTTDSPVVAQSSWATLINGTVFDDDPTEENSSAVDVSGYRGMWLELNIDSTLAPTDITFLPQFTDDDGTTWWDYQEGIWASMVFEDTQTASGIKKVFHLPLAGIDSMRIRVVATGTDGSNFFTVTVKGRAYR